MLGVEDFLNKRNTTVSIRCISDTGLLLVITGEDFFKYMSKDQEIWSMVGNATVEKDEATMGKLIGTNKTQRKYNEVIAINMDKPQTGGKFGLSASTMNKKKNFLNVIQKYNMRINEDRLDDFRTTIKEIVDVNIHGQEPLDK